MDDGALGRQYADGEVICRQGDPGDRMYVMQAGQAVVSNQQNGREVVLAELSSGDIFGEMAIFDREPRSATVRAKGTARVLTLDKRGFLKRVHEDPSLAYRILRDMSHRVRMLSRKLAETGQGVEDAPRYLLVVARDRPDLYRRLSEDFAEDAAIEVVVDRRSDEPSQASESPDAEQRRKDRRRADADAYLHSHGMMLFRARRGS